MTRSSPGLPANADLETDRLFVGHVAVVAVVAAAAVGEVSVVHGSDFLGMASWLAAVLGWVCLCDPELAYPRSFIADASKDVQILMLTWSKIFFCVFSVLVFVPLCVSKTYPSLPPSFLLSPFSSFPREEERGTFFLPNPGRRCNDGTW